MLNQVQHDLIYTLSAKIRINLCKSACHYRLPITRKFREFELTLLQYVKFLYLQILLI